MHFDNKVVGLVRTDIPTRRVASYTIAAKRLDPAGWMKTPLGTDVDLRAGHIVLDWFPALRERSTAPPLFRSMSYIVATVAHLSYC